jgi:hypothetical protein
MFSLGIAVWAFASATCAPVAHPIVTEVLYDASGDDTGLEFVEIFNPTSVNFPLAGLRLEAGDGSAPGRWTTRWTGTIGDSVAAGARIVIGGARVVPAPQAIVTLELQNGPDAIRLVWPDGAIEVVGYGALKFPEYACGDPAPDVASGQSLARVPDDADAGSNALDFRAATPTPGRANRPQRDAAWIPGAQRFDPERPAIGSVARLRGRIANRGRGAIDARGVRIHVRTAGELGARDVADTSIANAIAPGDSADLELDLALDPGKQSLELRLILAGDENETNDRDSLSIRVGPGPLELTEIQFHPASNEGEWVEVRNRDRAPVDPALFTLSDRGATRARLLEGSGSCEPESLILIAQDREALLARYPGLDPRRIWRASPWPALNNSDDESGIADAVVLRDLDGTLCERHDYSAAGIPSGVPIERVTEDLWQAARDPDGSPLAPPKALGPIVGRLVLEPSRLRAGDESGRISWSLPWPRASVTVEAYDLLGAPIARLFGEREVPGRGESAWNPRSLTPGVYVVVMRARGVPGGEPLTESRALRIDGVAP